MDELLAFGRKVLAAQPFSVLPGATRTRFERGHAEIVLPLRDDLKQQHGFAHGGVVSYLADNCPTHAGGSMPGDRVTSEYKINDLRPAVGQKPVARAEVRSSGKCQVVCACQVFAIDAGEEKPVAAAQGTIIKVEPRA